MEDKRRDSAATQSTTNADSPASDPSSSRRRGGAQKRKASNIGASTSSSTPSKRVTREKALLSSHPQIHNGPLTRARQGPQSLASASSAAALKPAAQAKRPDPAGEALAELVKRESELEALEASMEAEFDAIKSRGANAHVVPSHCGWFSWTKVHSIEEQMLPSFFNGKSETRTPDVYLEIRNCIMKKFHASPGTIIELKDLLEVELGDLDARQEVLEFLDHWGLINFHPFPQTGSALASVDGDGVAEKDSLVDKLYHFETLESRSSVVPKTNITTPTVLSGLFPESAIAEELVRPEGPNVEYHCNYCSADCSRKRYHCQKQADFDLCTDCFNKGTFDSGMSSSDFILMEPAEAHGVSGGKWTDQETLLLLEALELYKENWNEIAEHVATKTKAQCILHFVQMPIEDTFFDYEDDIDASAKETADPTSVDNDLLALKDGPNESDPQTSPMETSTEVTEVKAGQDTSKPEDVNEVKVGQETSKLEDAGELKIDQETDENFALKALKEAFEVVGYPPTPEGPLSFSEVGNPAMALAAFLGRLVGPDVGIASAHNSLKSITANSPGIELAARHCFLLEDPPSDSKEEADSKEQAGPDSVAAEGEVQKGEVHDEKSQKEDKDTSCLEDRDLSNDNGDKKLEKSSPEEKSQSAKEQDDIVTHEEVGADNLNKSDNSELPKDPPTIVGESDDSKVVAEHPLSSGKESGEGISVGKPSEIAETPRDVDMSDSLPSTNNEAQQPVTSSSVEEPSHSTEASKDVDAPDSLASERNDPQKQITDKSEKPPQPAEVPKDADMVCDPEPPQKIEPQHPVTSTSVIENGPSEDQTKDGQIKKHDSTEKKVDHKFDKIKNAAVSAVSAAAVKAKLLAEQEEDQIRQLAAMLVEKQLHKLEAKLAFFSEMESVVMRVREQLDRSRQKLYHERAQIIAARLGLPGSSSRAMPSSMPANRMVMNIANSVPRPPLSMTSQRPPMPRPMGALAPSPSNQFSSTTLAGSSIRPPI